MMDRLTPTTTMLADLAEAGGQVNKERWARFWAELEATLLPVSSPTPRKQLTLFEH
jgi:hypothetical protein